MTLNIGGIAATPAQLTKLRQEMGLGFGGPVAPFLSGGFAVFSGNTSSASAVTIQNVIQAPAAFCGMRLVYHNKGSADVTLTWSRVALTTDANTNGSALGYVNATFNGSASVTLPARAGSVTDDIMTPVVSDYLELTPLDAQNLIVTRSYYAAAASCDDAGTSTAMSEFRTASGKWYSATQGAGQILNAATITGASQAVTPHGLVLYYQNPVVSVSCFGGSHLRGNGTSGNAWGFMYRACMAKNAAQTARVYSPYMKARGGSGRTAAVGNLEKVLASGTRIDIALLLTASGNDSDPGVAGSLRSRGYLGRQLELCRRYNVRPIVCTQPPVPGATTDEHNARLANNLWTVGLRDYGIDVLDLADIYEDPTDRTRLLPAFDAGDGIHVNDVGQAYSRDALVAMLP